MSVTCETVLVTARTFLNDDAAVTFTDPVLLPKFTQAHRELQQKMRAASCPVMRTTSADISIPANTILLNLTSSPPYPSDMVEPIQLYERANGADISTMALMTEWDPLPYQDVSSGALTNWQWSEENILFTGSSVTRIIQIRYWRAVPIPTTTSQLIGIINGEVYLGPRVAALMAGTLGANPQNVAMASQIAEASIAQVIAANRGRRVPDAQPEARP